MIERLLISLFATLVLELAFALFWNVRKWDLALVAIINVLTNPLVVLWNDYFLESGLLISVTLPELCAIALEAFLLFRFGKYIKNPFLLAICLNVFSYSSGLLIFSFWRY